MTDESQGVAIKGEVSLPNFHYPCCVEMVMDSVDVHGGLRKLNS
jgi:hypothetical protein